MVGRMYSEELLNDEPYSKKYPEIMRKTLAFMQESLLEKNLFVRLVVRIRESVGTNVETQKGWLGCLVGPHRW